MRRSLRFSPEGAGGPPAYVAGGVAVFGVWSGHVAFGWGEWRSWFLDAAVGLAVLGSGIAAHRSAPRVGVLLIATAAAWWLGNVATAALFLHRGALVVCLWTYPEPRIVARNTVVALVAGALVTVPVLASSDGGTVLFGVVVLGGTVVRVAASGGAGLRGRRVALEAAAVVALGAVGAVALRHGGGRPVGADVATWWYQATIAVAGAMLALGVRRQPTGILADAVVELAASPRPPLRDRLADLLDDPELVVARRVDDQWVDDDGTPVVTSTSGRVMTVLPGEQVALVHDAAVARDPVLLDALESVTQLATRNADLELAMRRVLDELVASGQRLRDAEHEERRRLWTRLNGGVGRRLDAVAAHLDTAVAAVRDPSVADAIRRSIAQLDRTRADLVVISHGLHPAGRSALTDWLASLVDGLPVPVEVRTPAGANHLDAETVAALSYCCAEALSNAVKHARAGRIAVELSIGDADVVLTVTDDGVGGADVAGGSGLAGLRDRAAALGGTLLVDSASETGTRLTVTLPSRPALLATAGEGRS